MSVHSPSVGFIGQGFIGKHMADDFTERGFTVVRYALEEPYVSNRAAIADCDIVFIAVPTPTTPSGFDASILVSVLPLVGVGKVAVIKSTVLPGLTKKLADLYPDRYVIHAPEFLREKTAHADTRQPDRTIIGLPYVTEEYKGLADTLLRILPKAGYELVCDSREAELTKYGGNCFLALKVVYMNLLYDAATTLGVSYDVVKEAMAHDVRIGGSHMNVLDSSGHEGAEPGRGAGGHCFPKDLAALRAVYGELLPTDTAGQALLSAIEAKNNELLRQTSKDLPLLQGIYGT